MTIQRSSVGQLTTLEGDNPSLKTLVPCATYYKRADHNT